MSELEAQLTLQMSKKNQKYKDHFFFSIKLYIFTNSFFLLFLSLILRSFFFFLNLTILSDRCHTRCVEFFSDLKC